MDRYMGQAMACHNIPAAGVGAGQDLEPAILGEAGVDRHHERAHPRLQNAAVVLVSVVCASGFIGVW